MDDASLGHSPSDASEEQLDQGLSCRCDETVVMAEGGHVDGDTWTHGTVVTRRTGWDADLRRPRKRRIDHGASKLVPFTIAIVPLIESFTGD